MARSKKPVLITRQMYLTAKALDDESKKRKEGPITKEAIQDALHIPMETAADIKALLTYGKFIGSTREDVEVAHTELILSDIHIPHHDPEALEVAIRYGEQVKADTIVLLGDVIDFYKVSRFTKDPRSKSVSQEIDETVGFLRDLRKRFPKAKIVYYRGNHEMRLEHYVCNGAPQIFDLVANLLQNQLMFSELNIEYRTEPFKVGKLWHLHGHEKPGQFGAEHLPNVMEKYVKDHCIFGHFHRNQHKVFKRINGERYWIGAVGYLGGPQDYAPLNQWSQGFAVVNYDEQGRFRANIHEIVEGGVF